MSGRKGAKEQVCFARYSKCIVLKARPTCEVQSERDEAVIARQELQGFLSLDQSPKVICYSFTIEEVVDTNQEVPEANKAGICLFIYLHFYSIFFLFFVHFFEGYLKQEFLFCALWSEMFVIV